jgi:hypothetical protein
MYILLPTAAFAALRGVIGITCISTSIPHYSTKLTPSAASVLSNFSGRRGPTFNSSNPRCRSDAVTDNAVGHLSQVGLPNDRLSEGIYEPPAAAFGRVAI